MGDEPDQNDLSNPWGLEPQESGFVAFWPHAEPPTMEEVSGAMATWVGDIAPSPPSEESASDAEDGDSGASDDEEGEDRFKVQPLEPDGEANWCCAIHVPGITHALVVWCEPARTLSEPERAQLGDAAARAKWVIRVQTVLHAPDAAEDYFMAVGLIAGSMPDLVAMLDVVTSEVFDRATLDRLFVAEGAHPPCLWARAGSRVAGFRSSRCARCRGSVRMRRPCCFTRLPDCCSSRQLRLRGSSLRSATGSR
jgi:hypothetical protein